MGVLLKEFLLRLLSPKNVVPLLIIVAAFLSTFLQSPFGLQRDQIVLALLGFLAIDSLIERLEILHNIKQNVTRMKDLVEAQLLNGGVLKLRSECPPFEQVIEEAKHEVWISGINLAISAAITGVLGVKAEEGVKIKLLSIDPEGDSCGEIAAYFGYDEQEMIARIRANLHTLYSHLVQNFPDTVELRTTIHRLSSGYFAVDPDTGKGQMTVTAYLYQTKDSHLSPVLFLTKPTSPYWFDKYSDDFHSIWNDAKVWSPNQTAGKMITSE